MWQWFVTLDDWEMRWMPHDWWREARGREGVMVEARTLTKLIKRVRFPLRALTAEHPWARCSPPLAQSVDSVWTLNSEWGPCSLYGCGWAAGRASGWRVKSFMTPNPRNFRRAGWQIFKIVSATQPVYTTVLTLSRSAMIGLSFTVTPQCTLRQSDTLVRIAMYCTLE